MRQYQDPATAEAYARNLAKAGRPAETIASSYQARTGQPLPASLAQELGVRIPKLAPPLPAGIMTQAEMRAHEKRPNPKSGREQKQQMAEGDRYIESYKYYVEQEESR